MPIEDCEFGEVENSVLAMLLTTEPEDALPTEVLPSPFELLHGFPSRTSTGTATRFGELCVHIGKKIIVY